MTATGEGLTPLTGSTAGECLAINSLVGRRYRDDTDYGDGVGERSSLQFIVSMS
jgi:hypothetical protein